jgi:hypothetical protein
MTDVESVLEPYGYRDEPADSWLERGVAAPERAWPKSLFPEPYRDRSPSVIVCGNHEPATRSSASPPIRASGHSTRSGSTRVVRRDLSIDVAPGGALE